jgi:hypothetical protein
MAFLLSAEIHLAMQLMAPGDAGEAIERVHGIRDELPFVPYITHRHPPHIILRRDSFASGFLV